MGVSSFGHSWGEYWGGGDRGDPTAPKKHHPTVIPTTTYQIDAHFPTSAPQNVPTVINLHPMVLQKEQGQGCEGDQEQKHQSPCGK